MNDNIAESFDLRVIMAYEPNSGTTTATIIVEDENDGSVEVVVGAAKCNPSDQPDGFVGKNLAFSRALDRLAEARYSLVQYAVEDA